MKWSATLAAGLMLVTSSCYGQNPIVGRYVGYVTVPGALGDTNVGVEFAITEVDELGKVRASGRYYGIRCQDDFPMKGRYDGRELRIRSAGKFGPNRDCKINFRLVVKGSELVGHTKGKGRPVWLRKRSD